MKGLIKIWLVRSSSYLITLTLKLVYAGHDINYLALSGALAVSRTVAYEK